MLNVVKSQEVAKFSYDAIDYRKEIDKLLDNMEMKKLQYYLYYIKEYERD